MRFFPIAAALLLSPAMAFAADLPNVKGPPVYVPPPVFSWTGFYLGANGGYGWSEGSSGLVTATIPNEGSESFAGESVDSHGGIAGGQLGYNFQLGNLVLGGEGDFDWSGISGNTIPDPQNGPALESLLTAKQRWLSTVRARIGYAFGPVLVYATGGLAITDVSITDTKLVNSADTPRSGSNTHVGGTIGGGVEWAFADHWSVKVEYLYLKLDNENYFANTARAGLGFDAYLDVHTIKVGLNYRFGYGKAPVVAKY